MSAEARPISAEQFAQAIEDLPMENIYSKAHEIENSVAHLQRSNAQLQEYSDSIKNDTTLDEGTRSEGDRDCLEAIAENDIVIKRQLERIVLLKQEVERRGGRWHERNPQSESDTLVNGDAPAVQNGEGANATPAQPQRLTDEELRRRLEEQMGTSGDEDDPGMHL